MRLRTMQGASLGGANKRLSGHLASRREPLNLGEPGKGALWRSAPMGPSVLPPSLCGQKGTSGIRVSLTCIQDQAMVILLVSTAKMLNSASPR